MATVSTCFISRCSRKNFVKFNIFENRCILTRFLVSSFSYPIEFPQVFLLFLVNHNVDTGDGLGDNTDFAELGSSATGHFSHTKAAQLGFEVIELLDQLFLLLGTQFGALDTRLKVKIKFVLSSVNLTRYFSTLDLTNGLVFY